MILSEKYSPSEPCSCRICRSFCQRPGWWSVEEAEKAVQTHLAFRMMLEISPDRRFGVLSPAFKGNEVNYAWQISSGRGCTFFQNERCELFGTGFQPLECRFCHHDRPGLGTECHLAIEKEWNTPPAQRLIVRWGNKTGFWQKQGFRMVEKQ